MQFFNGCSNKGYGLGPQKLELVDLLLHCFQKQKNIKQYSVMRDSSSIMQQISWNGVAFFHLSSSSFLRGFNPILPGGGGGGTNCPRNF